MKQFLTNLSTFESCADEGRRSENIFWFIFFIIKNHYNFGKLTRVKSQYAEPSFLIVPFPDK